MTELLHCELTGDLIGAYYEVYNHTPRTFPEFIYESALVVEIERRGYPVARQDEYQIIYKERIVGLQRLDLFVVREVVVENKVVERLSPLNRVQGLSYLKTVGKSVGLLFNFGSAKPEFDRLFFDLVRHTPRPSQPPALPTDASDLLYPDLAYTIVGGLYEVHNILGPGFIHRIYCSACHHEMQLRDLAPERRKSMNVIYKGSPIGNVAFDHLVVSDQVMVFPIARRHIHEMPLDPLKAWMRACDIRLGILANFDAVRLDIIFIRA